MSRQLHLTMPVQILIMFQKLFHSLYTGSNRNGGLPHPSITLKACSVNTGLLLYQSTVVHMYSNTASTTSTSITLLQRRGLNIEVDFRSKGSRGTSCFNLFHIICKHNTRDFLTKVGYI